MLDHRRIRWVYLTLPNPILTPAYNLRPSSIGAACAYVFAEAGCSLALTYSSNVDNAKKLQEELDSNTEKHVYDGQQQMITIHKADLSCLEETEALCDEVRKEHGYRTIDIFISNAGYGKRIRDILDIPLAEFDKVHNINTRSAFVLCKDVVKAMKENRWGRIIFVSSIAAQGGGMNGCRTSLFSLTHWNHIPITFIQSSLLHFKVR